MKADYLVIGAGAAGSVLAARLVARTSARVLLLEAGGRDADPVLHVPLGFALALRRPRYTASYATEPTDVIPEPEAWMRGRVLGGSTAVNGMMYARGDATAYDELAHAGGAGWSWDAMLPVLRALEDHALEAGPQRGRGGPLPIEVPLPDDEVTSATLAAAAAAGIAPVADVNASSGPRIGPVPSTLRRGRRVSAWRAVVGRSRPANLRVLTGVRVGRLLLDGRRVVGLRARRGGSVLDVRVRREVLLAAGTIESPLLLERSGIGAPDVLRRAGVPVRVEQPQVGERVVEQRAVTVTARLHDGLGHNPRLHSPWGRLRAGARYLATRGGRLARGPFDLLALVDVEGEDRPDAQLLTTAMTADETGLMVEREPGLTIQGYQLRPSTRSSVHVTGRDPDDPPRIRARHLDTATDRRVAHGVLQCSRELLATPPLRDLVVAETAPGPEVEREEDVVRYARTTGHGIYHAVGSCAMGPRDDDVVDAELRVRGVEGLRVVDASVLPTMLSGGTAAPVMALAWRAADRISVAE